MRVKPLNESQACTLFHAPRQFAIVLVRAAFLFLGKQENVSRELSLQINPRWPQSPLKNQLWKDVCINLCDTWRSNYFCRHCNYWFVIFTWQIGSWIGLEWLRNTSEVLYYSHFEGSGGEYIRCLVTCRYGICLCISITKQSRDCFRWLALSYQKCFSNNTVPSTACFWGLVFSRNSRKLSRGILSNKREFDLDPFTASLFYFLFNLLVKSAKFLGWINGCLL